MLERPGIVEGALAPKKPFALTKPVQLLVDGQPPSGLEDSYGRLINGGNNAVAVLARRGVTITAVRQNPTDARQPLLPILTPADVDALLERIDTIELTRDYASVRRKPNGYKEIQRQTPWSRF